VNIKKKKRKENLQVLIHETCDGPRTIVISVWYIIEPAIVKLLMITILSLYHHSFVSS
jgi:hypothetical protein